MFGHKIWPLAKFQKLHIYSLSTPGVEIELIFALRATVTEIQANFRKLPYLGMKLGNWQVAHILYFYPRGVEIELIVCSTGSGFCEIKSNFTNCHIWQLAKVPEVAHILSFYPRKSKLSLFSVYGQRFPSYR